MIQVTLGLWEFREGSSPFWLSRLAIATWIFGFQAVLVRITLRVTRWIFIFSH
uniref:Uncharacterized protein n=1 Tax=Anguilla anguilla TaxID=7936 RepID=A0A0E9SFS7_ANGAN